MNQLSPLPPGNSTANAGADADAPASRKSAANPESDDSSSIAGARDAFDRHLPPHRAPACQHPGQKTATPDPISSTLPTIPKQQDKKASKDSSPTDSGSAGPSSTTVNNLVVPLLPVTSPLVPAKPPTVSVPEDPETYQVAGTATTERDSRLFPRSGSADPASTAVNNLVVPLLPVMSPLVPAKPSTVDVPKNSESRQAPSAGTAETSFRLFPKLLSAITPASVPSDAVPVVPLDATPVVLLDATPVVLLDTASIPIRKKEKSAVESEPTVLPEEPLAGKTIDRSIRVPMSLDAAPAPVKEKEKSAAQRELRIISEGPVAKKTTDRPPGQSPLALAARVVGTNAAKQHVVMSIAEIETNPKSEVFPKQPLSGVTSTPDQPHITISSARDSSFTPREGEADSYPKPGDLAEPAVVATGKFTAPAAAPEPTPQTPRVEEASRLFEEVSQAIERLRTDGRTNVELQIKLHDGGQLIVKVQMHAGEVKTIFKTDSAEWREAIAQGWSSFSSDSANRGMRVTNPVFESPAAQSGLNDFDNPRQQRREEADGREHNYLATPASSGKKASASTPSPLHEATLRGERITVWA
jgi:hypothetical protein